METDVKTGPVAIDGRKNTSGNLKNTIGILKGIV